MSFNISKFASEALKLGGARPTLFKVQLNQPLGGVTNGTNLNSLSSFLVQATSIPASTMGRIEVPYFGRKISVAGDRVFDVWNVNVLNDEDFAVRKILEEWHQKINHRTENLNTFNSSAPRNYKSDATVTQYGKDGKEIRQYKFVNMFPLEISAIQLDWNATDTIENFDVTFSYDWYEITR